MMEKPDGRNLNPSIEYIQNYVEGNPVE